MNATRRMLLSLVLALMLGAAVSNAAYAFHCSNPNINDKAVFAVVDEVNGTLEFTKSNWGTFGKFHGAWVKIIPAEGVAYYIWVKGVLPDGAMNAGPGDNLCDGKGIDDLIACLGG